MIAASALIAARKIAAACRIARSLYCHCAVPALVHGLLDVVDQLVGLAVGMPFARSVFTCVVANVLRVQIVMIWKRQGIDLENALSQELP